MGLAVLKTCAPFTLHVRCENCMRESLKIVEMPIGDDVPRDVDDLAGSAFLEQQSFRCRPCGGVIGIIVGIEQGADYAW